MVISETKSSPMADNYPIRNVRIDIADNGFIVRYDKYEKNESSTYDGMYYCGQLVFTFKDQKAALDEFIKLGKASGKLSETSMPSEDEAEEEE
jgi:hypothetical protein